MADIVVRTESLSLDEPILAEGLPGLGLVGKIAVDHLVDQLDFEYYADIVGDGIPPVTTFTEGETEVRSPIRLHANEAEDLVVLEGDVPISVANAPGFTESLTDWVQEQRATPLFLTGFPAERELDVEPEIYGVATGDGDEFLEEIDITPPDKSGLISGPAGGLLREARAEDLDSVGFIVETSPQFPDPQGARKLIDTGIEPLVNVEVDTEALVEQADEIIEQREQLAQQMREANQHESSQAAPIGFQ